MRGSAHRSERVEERLEHAGLAQPIEPLPNAVPMTEPFGQRTPSHVLDAEEMQRLQKQPVVLGFASSTRKAGPKYGEHMRPVLFIHPRRHDFRPPNRSEVYESHQIQAGNRENLPALNSSTRPNVSHGRLPQVVFNASTLAHRGRRGASTPGEPNFMLFYALRRSMRGRLERPLPATVRAFPQD